MISDQAMRASGRSGKFAALCADRSARRVAPGLVSVPTTRSGGFTAPVAAAEADAGRAERLKQVGAFVLDKAGKRFSDLRRAVGFAARAHAVSEKGKRSDVAWMVTLTYVGDNSDWQGTHLTTAMSLVRKWCSRNGYPCRYVWVAELQKRGVIHYHAVYWLPKGVAMPKWDRRGWWPHGMTNTLKARHATAYLMSYLKKGDLESRGSLPKGARNYGVGGLDHSLRRARRWLGLPKFIQGNSSILDDWRRVVGGGWLSPDGEHFQSEFQQVMVGGVRALIRVCTHPVQLEPAGPFSWLSDRPISFEVMQ